MHRSIHTLAVLLFALTVVAQVPSYTIEIIPPPKALAAGGASVGKSTPTADRIFYVRSEMDKRKLSGLELVSVDRKTQEVLGRAELPLDQHVEDLLVFNGKVFVISVEFDKSGTYDYYATPHSLSDLRSVGERTHVAHITFKGVGMNDLAATINDIRFRSKFIPSTDGTHMAFYCGGASTEKHEQVVFANLLDGDMKPVWESTRSIAFTSNDVEEEGIVAADDGSINVLLRASFKDRLFFSKAVNYTYEVFRFQGDKKTSQPIHLPADKFAATASIAVTDGALVVAGAYVEGEKSRTIAGCYAAYLDATGSEPTYSIAPLPTTVELQDFRKASLLSAADGMHYLVGSSFTLDLKANGITSSDVEGPLYVSAFHKDLSPGWSSIIQRKVVNGRLGTGVKALLVEDMPVLVFTDHPGNAAAYKAGNAGEARGDERVALLAAFDTEGKVDVAPLQHRRSHLSSHSIGEDLGHGVFGAYHPGNPFTGDTEMGVIYVTFKR